MTMANHLMIVALDRGTATIPLIIALREPKTTTTATLNLSARTLIYRGSATMIVTMFNVLRES